MNVAAAHAVQDISQVAQPRRVALVVQMEFSEERAGKVALVVTEFATNLAKHATGGEILF
jgi:anti-sigma regulatory factor (Ser/Thr protein kinase)